VRTQAWLTRLVPTDRGLPKSQPGKSNVGMKAMQRGWRLGRKEKREVGRQTQTSSQDLREGRGELGQQLEGGGQAYQNTRNGFVSPMGTGACVTSIIAYMLCSFCCMGGRYGMFFC